MSAPSFVLARLPCGCAVERSMGLRTQSVDGTLYIECPWCDCTFNSKDVIAWSSADTELFIVSKPTVLVRVGEKLFEVTGACSDCEVLIAREGPGGANLHLRVPATEIVFLEN